MHGPPMPSHQMALQPADEPQPARHYQVNLFFSYHEPRPAAPYTTITYCPQPAGPTLLIARSQQGRLLLIARTSRADYHLLPTASRLIARSQQGRLLLIACSQQGRLSLIACSQQGRLLLIASSQEGNSCLTAYCNAPLPSRLQSPASHGPRHRGSQAPAPVHPAVEPFEPTITKMPWGAALKCFAWPSSISRCLPPPTCHLAVSSAAHRGCGCVLPE